MSTYDVTVHELWERKPKPGEKRRRRPWRLRWVVAGDRFDLWYATKALADQERSKLLRAMANGEAFDEVTGRPDSETRLLNRETWFQHAQAYVKMKWPGLAPKSRKSTVEALVTVTSVLLVPGKPPDRKNLRAVLAWAFNPNKQRNPLDEPLQGTLEWIEQHSLPVVEVAKSEHTRAALDACARTSDGSPAAATTTRRKRAVLYNAFGYAIERELLPYNPIDKVQWKAPEVVEEVDRRVVASTAQVEAILAKVPEVHDRAGHYVAFFGCIYYGALRPSEAAGLHRDDMELPEKGWGRFLLNETAPAAGSDWTDNGEVRQVRGLKHRAKGHVRSVPMPPELVKMLREHIEKYGLGEDGLLFRGRRGGPVAYESYARVWTKARAMVLTSRQVKSPLARRPYDLRHAAVTLWLNGGVPAPEVARRAGHGVAVLLKVYAGCIDGEEKRINASIANALNDSRAQGAARVQGKAKNRSSGRKPRSTA